MPQTACNCCNDTKLGFTHPWYHPRSPEPTPVHTECYIKCLKNFFGYSTSYSVTMMLVEIDIPDFDSVVNNFKRAFKQQYMRCSNPVVRQLVMLHVL